MGRFIRLSLALFIGILLSFNVSSVSAQKIKYSISAYCDKNNDVTCKINEHNDNKEVAVCIKSGSSIEAEENSHYRTQCSDTSIPRCIDTSTGLVAENVVIHCVEYAECRDNIAHCSEGKTARCLGNDSECECSKQICDYYTWEISDEGSYN